MSPAEIDARSVIGTAATANRSRRLPRTGYVLKMYPRFSETFVVTEILAHEAAGADLEIFSLRSPADGRFHAALADVRAPVTYLSAEPSRPSGLWTVLSEASSELPDLWACMDELVSVPVQDAVQAVALACMVRQRGIEHLHAHFGSVATTVARLAARLAGVPYSFTAHAKDIFHADVDAEDLRRKLSDAAAVVTVSDHNVAHLRDRFGSAAGRVARVYNGLDLARFRYQPPVHRPPLVVGVGRLVEKKGFADLVAATALLADRGADVRCLIVGDGELAGDLAEQVHDLGLGGRVELVGPRPQDDVRRLVQQASVLAAPCVVADDGNRDGLPTVLLEAMALGTPCVATPVTGIPEIVRDGVTGLLVPQRSPSALADAIARLLDDAELRVRLAARGRALIEADFDSRRQARRMREHAFVGRHAQRALLTSVTG